MFSIRPSLASGVTRSKTTNCNDGHFVVDCFYTHFAVSGKLSLKRIKKRKAKKVKRKDYLTLSVIRFMKKKSVVDYTPGIHMYVGSHLISL